jgi:hypothetical protein
MANASTAALRGATRLPFAQQSQYFRNKLALPSASYDTILGDEHDHGFIVAGATKADLVNDFKNTIQQVIDDGQSIGWFREHFDQIVAKHGWTGWKGQDTPAGVAWRTRVIYTTNLRTSHAAARYAQMTTPEMLKRRPYWRWVHRSEQYPRPQHLAWHGMVLPANDPWFLEHYPPCEWGCNCIIEALNEREVRALGKSGPDAAPPDERYDFTVPATGEVVSLPVGVGYGWNHIAGQSAAQQALAIQLQKLETIDVAIARANTGRLRDAPVFEHFMAGQLQGDFPLAVVNPVDQASSDRPALALLSQSSLTAHLAAHPEVRLQDYQLTQQILDRGQVVQQGDRRVVTLTVGSVHYRIVLDPAGNGSKNVLLSLFRDRTASAGTGTVP